MSFNHPWIDEGLDAEEMEAVLVATNELPIWEPSATMRAFQTYLWSNGSTGNDQVSFVHDETGVIVCHEGNVVGIECGHGSLADALPDLIQVLHSLGWRGAQVYCLTAHIHEVLADIGRSIPANLDFDLQEGKRGMPVAEMPEAQNMLDHGRAILRAAMGGDGMTADDRALAALQSLDEPDTPAAFVGRVVLDDDDERADLGDEIVVSPTVSCGAPAVLPAAAAPSLTIQAPASEDGEDGPRVFEFLHESQPHGPAVTPPSVVPSMEVTAESPVASAPAIAVAPVPAAPIADGNVLAESAGAQRALETGQDDENARLKATIAELQKEIARLAVNPSPAASSIEICPDYPFVRIGLAYDFHPHLANIDPSEHAVDREDWWIEIAGEITVGAYPSRASALEAVERSVFSDGQTDLVPQQIECALATGNVRLALRLAEGNGKAIGRQEARNTFAAALIEVDSILRPFNTGAIRR